MASVIRGSSGLQQNSFISSLCFGEDDCNSASYLSTTSCSAIFFPMTSLSSSPFATGIVPSFAALFSALTTFAFLHGGLLGSGPRPGLTACFFLPGCVPHAWALSVWLDKPDSRAVIVLSSGLLDAVWWFCCTNFVSASSAYLLSISWSQSESHRGSP